jgi:hypothetical protein
MNFKRKQIVRGGNGMFSGIRARMTYANVVATVAMVFAMTGGAYAASKVLITSTKQIKPSVLASLKGKAGANGAPGAAGPAGSGGLQGPVGAAGPKGDTGATGATGATGPAGPKGAAGAAGQTGFTETLPKGKTEKGVWSINHREQVSGFSRNFVPISFAIPLAAEGEAFYIDYTEQQTKGELVKESGCTGSASEPTAPEGKLCIYTAEDEELANIQEPIVPLGFDENIGHYSKPGAFLEFVILSEGHALAFGGWAVTGA